MFNIHLDIDRAELQSQLRIKGWLLPDEAIKKIEKPGEGNMNVVLRVITDNRSFILKQSRPFVQKYEQIEAPLHRIAVEYEFYEAVQNNALHAHIPKILGYDVEEHLLLLEDLGACDDMVIIYNDRKIGDKKLEKLLVILGLIHRTKVPTDFPDNIEMRRLNHQHIFELPFMEDNGFSLDDIQPGLQNVSLPYKKDAVLKKKIEAIGHRYLSQGSTLLHGDYYPGSWMTEANNLYVIDPEFGFVGFSEFDLGVMAAHIIMATGKLNYLDKIHDQYDGVSDKKLMSQIAGIEIMRRLIGLAQLPLERSLEEKASLLKTAYKMILT